MNTFEKILSDVERIKNIVESWKTSNNISPIERKIVKDYLAKIYENVDAGKYIVESEKEEITTIAANETTTSQNIDIVIEKTETIINTPAETNNYNPARVNGNQQSVKTLGETLQSNKRFLSDDFGEKENTVLSPISDLSKGIGLNDKFLFAKELFDGNAQNFDQAINKINSFSSIDEALQYINLNFSWLPENPIAKHFLSLVHRRFL